MERLRNVKILWLGNKPTWKRSLNFHLRAGFVVVRPRLKLPL
jgi:hypothetical protein